MNNPDFSTQQSKQYQEFRQKLVELLNRVDAPVQHAAEVLGMPREDSLPATREKLLQDRFSLVLIGAFQSGKSTLFNYLCDGRELSPVGPGGGGIRTSGCRVSAHPVEEGGREYANVSWRTKGQLLRSLGDKLAIYYENAKGTSYLTEDLVNLDNEGQRNQLAEHAWKELTEKQLTETNPELMRFALIVCAFYPKFAGQISRGMEEREVDDAVIVSSYPQDWESRWEKVKGPQDVAREFSLEDVTFAFCGGVDFYLDSANLRALGCSVNDCPGLFISEWDTEIAKDCIRKADAVLYQFGGEKAMTQADLDALKACVTLGGKHKLIFGANLKIPRNQWSNIEKNAVAPTLRSNGFDNPEIHAIHAGIALRAREAMLHGYGMLSEPSRRAIGIELEHYERELTDDNISWFLLKKQLKRFIETLTDDDEELSDFCDEDGKVRSDSALAQLSAVPELIQCANDFVTQNRFESILLKQGCSQIVHDLECVAASLTTNLGTITGNIEAKRKELNDIKEKLDDLHKKANKSLKVVWSDLRDGADALFQHYAKELDDKYTEHAVPKIKNLFLDIKPSWLVSALFSDKKRLSQEFTDEFRRICCDCFTELRQEITATMREQPGFRQISDSFEAERQSIKKDFAQLGDFSPVVDIRIKLSDAWHAETANRMLPSQETIADALTEDATDFWNGIWDLLTFGVWRLFIDEGTYADEFIKEHDKKFRKTYREALSKALNQDDAPFGILRKKYEEFKAACTANLQRCSQQLASAEHALAMANSPQAQDMIARLKESMAQMQASVDEAKRLEAEIAAAAKDMKG